MGWFYGFKLHLVVNDQGELLAIQLTPGKFDDRRPVPTLAKRLWGKLFGDKGYISKKLMEQLWQDYDLQSIPRLRKNMQHRLIEMQDKVLLRNGPSSRPSLTSSRISLRSGIAAIGALPISL